MTEAARQFEIADFRPSDFEEVAALFQEVYKQTYPHFDPKFLAAERFRKILRDHTLPRMKLITARYRDRLVGFVAHNENWLDQLYIHSDFQGLGLGGRFVEIAKENEGGVLDLYTFASNVRAIAFYERHGFEIVERSIAPDEKEPDVRMRWRRSPQPRA